MSTLVIDTIQGKTAASTVNIKTGGVNTNLSKVIAKSYVAYQTTNPTQVLDSQSFNHSSLTDIGTGYTKPVSYTHLTLPTIE